MPLERSVVDQFDLSAAAIRLVLADVVQAQTSKSTSNKPIDCLILRCFYRTQMRTSLFGQVCGFHESSLLLSVEDKQKRLLVRKRNEQANIKRNYPLQTLAMTGLLLTPARHRCSCSLAAVKGESHWPC